MIQPRSRYLLVVRDVLLGVGRGMDDIFMVVQSEIALFKIS